MRKYTKRKVCWKCDEKLRGETQLAAGTCGSCLKAVRLWEKSKNVTSYKGPLVKRLDSMDLFDMEDRGRNIAFYEDNEG